MVVAAKPTEKPASGLGAAETARRARSTRWQLRLFMTVNLVLLLVWVLLLLAEVPLHGSLWAWPVVMLLWLGRILLVDRRTRREHRFSDEQIEREMRRLH